MPPLRWSRCWAGSSALGYALLLAALYFGQESLIFPGTPLPAEHRFAFDQPFEEIRVPVDGGSLDALLFRQPSPRGLVFFLHGNRGNLQTWTTGLDFYRRVNYDLFIFDYRGYGRSTGQNVDERQLDADVRAAWTPSRRATATSRSWSTVARWAPASPCASRAR